LENGNYLKIDSELSRPIYLLIAVPSAVPSSFTEAEYSVQLIPGTDNYLGILYNRQIQQQWMRGQRMWSKEQVM